MSVSERAYSVLLSSLYRASGSTPLPTLQALMVHYLVRLLPAPTPLAAAIISSPLFRPFTLLKLDALRASFRRAVHEKLRALKEDPSGVFSPSLSSQLNGWSTAVLRGLEGGHAVIRLACCSGLLLGLEDVLQSLPSKQPDLTYSVQDQLLLAFADVIDLFTSPDSWRKEFSPETENGEDAITLALIISSQALLVVSQEKFVALPLPTLTLVVHTIKTAFLSGTFLSDFASSLERHSEYRVYVKRDTFTFREIDGISSSHAMSNMAALSKLCSRSVALFTEHRPKLALSHVQEIFLCLESISRNVEHGWLSSNLTGVPDESIAPETRPLVQSIWAILKTLLFSTIMITEAGLSAVVYAPPALSHVAPSLALAALRNLWHLAFVIEKFGGAGHGTFPELKRAFYLALDVLAEFKAESEHFVQETCKELWSNARDPLHPVQQAKKAFALSAIEQLVPVLKTSTIQMFVLLLASPHLDDASHREIFEASHSVVLAIFSLGTQKSVETIHSTSPPDAQHEREAAMFITTMVPFYSRCLVENSAVNKLNVAQLRRAFAALVKSACSTGDYALAWFCIDSVLTACRTYMGAGDAERVHRLHLALVSGVSSVPLALLPRVLAVLRGIINAKSDDVKRAELVEALFEEIGGGVGDSEKEFAVHWWNERCVEWAPRNWQVGARKVGPGQTTGLGEVAMISKL